MTLTDLNSFTHLSVCGTCFTLCGSGLEPWQQQLCDCTFEWERRDAAQAAAARTGEPWARVADLCRSCGAEVVETTTSRSVWFCDTCLAWARTINRSQHRPVVPIGRHTDVNQVLPEFDECESDEEKDAAGRLHELVGRSHAVIRRGRQVVEAHLEAAGYLSGQDVPLADYLRAVRSNWIDQERLFTRLSADLCLGPHWRGYGKEALEPEWTTKVDAVETYVAELITPWHFDDGRQGKTTLVLQILVAEVGSWLWSVSLTEEAAPEEACLLASGIQPSVALSAREATYAAIHVIEREKDRRDGRTWLLAPLTPDPAAPPAEPAGVASGASTADIPAAAIDLHAESGGDAAGA